MENKPNVLYLHGFASSAKNSKAEWLRQKNQQSGTINFYPFDFNPTPVDFSTMTVTGMINRLRQFILDHKIQNPMLVGSSLGALVALHYAHLFADCYHLLLLAPALRFYGDHFDQNTAMETGSISIFHYAFNQTLPLMVGYFSDGQHYQDLIPPPQNITILHGNRDDIVPFQDSVIYAEKFSSMVNLQVLETDHRMADQVDVIWQWIRKLSIKNP